MNVCVDPLLKSCTKQPKTSHVMALVRGARPWYPASPLWLDFLDQKIVTRDNDPARDAYCIHSWRRTGAVGGRRQSLAVALQIDRPERRSRSTVASSCRAPACAHRATRPGRRDHFHAAGPSQTARCIRDAPYASACMLQKATSSSRRLARPESDHSRRGRSSTAVRCGDFGLCVTRRMMVQGLSIWPCQD